MATLVPYLTEGFEFNFDGSKLSARVPYFLEDLETDAGGDAMDLLAEAFDVPGFPQYDDSKVIRGRTIYARQFSVRAWADNDAEVLVTWVEDDTAIGGIGTEIEVGTSYEMAETDFDAANRELPWAERTPMYVLWNPAVDGATVDSEEFRQAVRLPYFAGKPFRRYTKTISEDPGELSEQYATFTNSSPWKGYPEETVLCLSIVGRNAGNGGFRTTFEFAIDRVTKWRAVGRARDKATGDFVALTNAQVAGYNGISDFVVQGSKDFNDLPI